MHSKIQYKVMSYKMKRLVSKTFKYKQKNNKKISTWDKELTGDNAYIVTDVKTCN